MTSSLFEGKMYKFKEVSTRLIRPTEPEVNVPLLTKYLSDFQSSSSSQEEMGHVTVYDEGLAQYLLCDRDSHHIFYAALILGKPRLRCRMRPTDEEAPVDRLEECAYRLTLIDGSIEDENVKKLIEILGKKNYKFG